MIRKEGSMAEIPAKILFVEIFLRSSPEIVRDAPVKLSALRLNIPVTTTSSMSSVFSSISTLYLTEAVMGIISFL
ncbi:hypothetical protein D3C86_867680 [compost metagenome]